MEASPFKFPVIREPAGPGSGPPSTTTATTFDFGSARESTFDLEPSAISTTAYTPGVYNFRYRDAPGGAFHSEYHWALPVQVYVPDPRWPTQEPPRGTPVVPSIDGIKAEIAKIAGVSRDRITLFNNVMKKKITSLQDFLVPYRYLMEETYMISDPMSQPELEWGATRRSRGRRSKSRSKSRRSKSRRSKGRSKSRRSKSRRSRR